MLKPINDPFHQIKIRSTLVGPDIPAWDVDWAGGFVFVAAAGYVIFVVKDTRGACAKPVRIASGNLALAELFGRDVSRSVVAVLFQLNAVVYWMRDWIGYFMFIDCLVAGMDRVARATGRLCLDYRDDAFAMAVDHDSPFRTYQRAGAL